MAQSARSLQYLVLDEFHTYDGAQGTDVSMLLRRLGLALKAAGATTTRPSPRPTGPSARAGHARGDSATLGDKGDPRPCSRSRDRLRRALPARQRHHRDPAEPQRWIGDAPQRVTNSGYLPAALTPLLARDLATGVSALPPDTDGRGLTDTVLAALWSTSTQRLAGITDEQRLDLLKGHPVTPVLLDATADAVAVPDLVRLLAGDTPPPAGEEELYERAWGLAVSALLAAFSAVRAVIGRQAASVDLHLWVRELTRVDRAASSRPEYLWSDDGDASVAPAEATAEQSGRRCPPSTAGTADGPAGPSPSLRPGWTSTPTTPRSGAAGCPRRPVPPVAARPGRRRPGAHRLAGRAGPRRGTAVARVQERRLLTQVASDDPRLRAGAVLPVLTHLGEDAGKASLDDTCPACAERTASASSGRRSPRCSR